MTLDLLGHVPQLTTKNKKRLDHRRSQTTPSPSSQHEIYRKLSLRKLEGFEGKREIKETLPRARAPQAAQGKKGGWLKLTTTRSRFTGIFL